MRALLTCLVGLALVGAGCESFQAKEIRYLQSAQDQATQADVRAYLGAPQIEASTETGDLVWVYEVRQVEQASNNSWSGTGSWCDEYVLTFDQAGLLRRWTHKSQLHRGVSWPAYCVTDGFKPAF